jgi:hypothetical protein
MKKLKSYDEYINEGSLPEWAQPTSDLTSGVRKDNYQDHQDPSQSMTRFTPGDRVIEVETGIEGEISSLGDGMNTITWYCDTGMRHDSKAQQLELSQS